MPVFEWEQVEHGTRLTCHVTIVRDEPDPLPGLYQEIIDELRSRYQDWGGYTIYLQPTTSIFSPEQVRDSSDLTFHITRPFALHGYLHGFTLLYRVMLEENMPDQSTEDEEAGGQVNENEEGENEDERSNDDDDDDCSSDNTLVSIESGDEEIDFSFAISGFIQMSDASVRIYVSAQQISFLS